MDPRVKRIIILSVAALLVLAIVWFGWTVIKNRTTPTPPIGGLPADQIGTPSDGTTTTEVTTTTVPPPTEAQKTASRLARLFVERFGTFTSQGQFESVTEVQPLTTTSMSAWMSGTYLPGLRAKYPSGTYAAQTTQVLGIEIEEESDQGATILVRTQQTFAEGDLEPVVTNPSMRLSLVKTGDEWFVDSALWILP